MPVLCSGSIVTAVVGVSTHRLETTGSYQRCKRPREWPQDRMHHRIAFESGFQQGLAVVPLRWRKPVVTYCGTDDSDTGRCIVHSQHPNPALVDQMVLRRMVSVKGMYRTSITVKLIEVT